MNLVWCVIARKSWRTSTKLGRRMFLKLWHNAFSHSSPTKDLKNALQGLMDDDVDDLKEGEYSDICRV